MARAKVDNIKSEIQARLLLLDIPTMDQGGAIMISDWLRRIAADIRKVAKRQEYAKRVTCRFYKTMVIKENRNNGNRD